MSFQGLISGSECAAPTNPLSQVLKHTESDRSIQQLHQLPGLSTSSANRHDLALARQFFESNPHAHGLSSQLLPAHAAELRRLDGFHDNRTDLNDVWVEQNNRAYPESSNAAGAWSAEYGITSQIPSQVLLSHTNQRAPYPTYSSSVPMTMYGVGPGLNMYQGANNILGEGKGKGREREADFEAAFAQVAASLLPTQTETSRIVEVENEIASLEGTVESLSLESVDADSEYGTDFKKVWDHLQNSDLPPPKEDLSKWESEFNQLMSAQRDDLSHDYGVSMQRAWEGGIGNLQEKELESPRMHFDAEGIPILGDYIFERNNKYINQFQTRSLLDDAKALLDQNGSLSEAALLLEAAIQKGELGEGGYEAWIILGETRNMDEREDAGMRALVEGVRRAEEAGVAGAGMMSLAISYTNESFDRASHTTLLRWLRARFPSMEIPDETIKAMTTHSSWDTHSRITDLFLNLARSQHAQGVMDPEVQVGLGVLFYTNGDYDRAKDCFESALIARPKDYLLWNRLGSSLSNGSKPEEALGAYREALELRPTYTRAIYNVGVACLNIGAHKEAAEHFLSALNLQESTSGDTSEQLWFTLRRALLSMDRPDLAELAKPEAKTSLDIFRRDGFDF
ncbi:hypothetical protein BDZ94DRAFT_1151032 [Collybia nuda]|uniref:Peroxisomal targeting signal 1 receptor n=1 Tax=Collybia nuda TaxID=64659 RepID=A0A9P5YH94_9AGAR|nr:hypothetical protein BDZ94DRAFT_1151032 [Collybia nuda]